MTDIAEFFPRTFELATAAIILAVIVGVPAGVLAAARPGSRLDHVVRVVSLAGQSIPVFVLGLISLLVLYAELGWLPGSGQIGVLYEGTVPDITGMLVVDSVLAGELGGLSERARPSRPAGAGARPLQPRLHHADDPRLHAGGARLGIYRDGARERRARARGAVAPRLRQYLRSAW